MCDEVNLAPGQGATDAMWLFHIRREQRRHGARFTPSLRVAAKCGVRFVARLAKGPTIAFASLRAAIRIWPQRIMPTE
jgi:hypothetical protein